MNLVPDLDFWHLVIFRAAQTAALALLFVPISTVAYATIPRGVERRCRGPVQHGAQRVRRHRHFGIHRAGHRASADPPGASDPCTLTPANQPYNVLLQQVQQGLMDAGQSMAQADAERARPGVPDAAGQVAVLAYNDVFLITACLSFVMIPTALLMSGIKAKASGGGH